ncbi:hypothetical protein BT96DRAFT_736814, partial [Gymnopus androsaceus JB14]
GMGNREAQEHFQRSGDTIHKAFYHVLKITSSPPFYNAYVHLPEDEVPAIIPNNPCFHAFCDAHAAGDGS